MQSGSLETELAGIALMCMANKAAEEPWMLVDCSLTAVGVPVVAGFEDQTVPSNRCWMAYQSLLKQTGMADDSQSTSARMTDSGLAEHRLASFVLHDATESLAATTAACLHILGAKETRRLTEL